MNKEYKKPRYFVGRQHYYYSDIYCVEIAVNGIEYSNADLLSEKYPHLGEGYEYDDVTEAVDVAIKIAKQWVKDSKMRIDITHGCTGGYSFEFDPVSIKNLRIWAIERQEKDKLKLFEAIENFIEQCECQGYVPCDIHEGLKEVFDYNDYDWKYMCDNYCNICHSEIEKGA